MTEVERAEQIASGPRRRFWQNIAMVSALVIGAGSLVVALYLALHRADTAETSAVSLAEQVQDRCDTEGSFLVGDRDLCVLAADVVEDPGAELVPVNGRDGIDGARGPQGVQGIQGRTGPPGEIGPRGPLGKPGQDGVNGTDGVNGLNGADGRGILSMQCATGGWAIEYTDGFTDTDAGPCQGPQGVHGEQGPASTVPGPKGDTGPQGTAKPGEYACPDGEVMTGFTVADDGAVTLACEDTTPPIIETPQE